MYKSIVLNKRQQYDFEMIINGGFSPLKGFMNQTDYYSCINDMIIYKDNFFPIPITLCITEEQKEELLLEEFVILKHETGLHLGLMDIRGNNSIYKSDIEFESKGVFGVYDTNHPYIQILSDYVKEGKIYNIGGTITKIQDVPHYDFKDIRLTPKETKEYFKKNRWDNVIGFQTRNPMHKSHFELTKYALSEVPNSKLLLHPVVGVTQDCDIDYFTRVKCYKKLVKYYDENTVLLSLLPLSMRMAGPREALIHALIRKNYGCTHFVVGRDHAGPSSKKQDGTTFFEPYQAQELLLKYADVIGIKPIISKEIVYAVPLNRSNKWKYDPVDYGRFTPIDKVDMDTEKVLSISGTKQRELLRSGQKIPEWFSFPDIVEELRNSVNNSGLCLYFIGLSGSGKSTLVNFLTSRLKEIINKPITILDGDIVRNHLSKGLGFSQEDRSTNIRRIGYVASEIVKHNGIVLVANIAPYEDDRQYNRKLISQYGHYVEIFVNTTLETCEERDVKNLYKLARKGIIKDFTGISSPFEAPITSEIVLDNGNTIEENLDITMNYITEHKFI